MVSSVNKMASGYAHSLSATLIYYYKSSIIVILRCCFREPKNMTWFELKNTSPKVYKICIWIFQPFRPYWVYFQGFDQVGYTHQGFESRYHQNFFIRSGFKLLKIDERFPFCGHFQWKISSSFHVNLPFQ